MSPPTTLLSSAMRELVQVRNAYLIFYRLSARTGKVSMRSRLFKVTGCDFDSLPIGGALW